MSPNLYRPGGRVIQGCFSGGRPTLIQPAATPPARPAAIGSAAPLPGIVRPAAPIVPAAFRPGSVQPKKTPPRPDMARGPILPPRPNAVHSPAVQAALRPGQAASPPGPILPAASRPAALQPSADKVFALPANFALKPSVLGQRLPEPVRQKMEAHFKTDFSDVRVHVGSEASSIGALAFTLGTDLYFAAGQYNPQTPQGQRLLGHELTHVVQQRAGRVRNPLGSGIAVVQDPGLEAEADRMAQRAIAPTPIQPTTARANPIGTTPRTAVQPAARPPSGRPPVSRATSAPNSGRGTPRLGRVVQRKVGFEMEMSVPTFAVTSTVDIKYFKNGPTGASPSRNVQMFLLGGLPYGAAIGKNTHFRLTSDHNELQSKGTAIANKLIEMGYIQGFVPKNYRTVSNLEYVTEALEELAPDSTTAYTQQFTAVKNHMDLVWNEAKLTFKKIPTPAGEYYTGVPVDDLRAWLGDRYNEIEPMVTEFQAAIHDSLYLQATVGIIPSALRDLHKKYVAENPEDRELMQAVAAAADSWVETLVNRMLELNDPYVKDITTPETGMFSSLSTKRPEIELEAFKGVMHLCLMYVIGMRAESDESVRGVLSEERRDVPLEDEPGFDTRWCHDVLPGGGVLLRPYGCHHPAHR